jgi:hypothetical protein
MKIGAIASRIRASNKRKMPTRHRSASEDELMDLKLKQQEDITDIDIRENTKKRLKYRKLPWTEWLLALAFILGGLVLLAYGIWGSAPATAKQKKGK